MFYKKSKKIGPFPDPSDNRSDDKKFHFSYDTTGDYFKVEKVPAGHTGVGKKYYSGSKAYRTLMKYRSSWDTEEETFNEELVFEIPEATTTFSEKTDLIFGDSQIQGELGKAIQSRYGGVRVYKVGSNPSQWAPGGEYFDLIKNYVEMQPNNIYVALGGNSSKGIVNLLSYISEASPDSKVTLFSPPPPAYNGTRYSYNDFKNKRMSNNLKIISAAVTFKNVKLINLHEILQNGYFCKGEEKCDGIHLSKSAVNTIFSKIT